MSLKSIRESYQNLITVFNDAGIKLNESQKKALDTFVLELESTMSNQRTATIKKTAKAVQKKMERQYQTVFESILNNMAKHAELTSKIQEKSVQLKERQNIAEKVDSYLDLYVESVLPKKTIIDYDRMQKLERIHESLCESLALNDEKIKDVEKKLEEKYEQKKSVCESKVTEMKIRLDNANAKMKKMQQKFDVVKGTELLESKTKDLVPEEARKVKKQLAGKTEKEITEKFEKTLKNVQDDADRKAKDFDLALEDEIKKIVDEQEVDENDMLRNGCTPHNGNGVHNGDDPTLDEQFETMEQIKFNDDGEIQLDESDIIDANLMSLWCNQSIEVR